MKVYCSFKVLWCWVKSHRGRRWAFTYTQRYWELNSNACHILSAFPQHWEYKIMAQNSIKYLSPPYCAPHWPWGTAAFTRGKKWAGKHKGYFSRFCAIFFAKLVFWILAKVDVLVLATFCCLNFLGPWLPAQNELETTREGKVLRVGVSKKWKLRKFAKTISRKKIAQKRSKLFHRVKCLQPWFFRATRHIYWQKKRNFEAKRP